MAGPRDGSYCQMVFGWILVIGIVFHLLGEGEAFVPLLACVLTLLMVIGGLLVMGGLKTPGEVLGSVVFGGIALLVLPPLISRAVRDFWHSITWPTTVFLVAGILLVAVLLAGGKW